MLLPYRTKNPPESLPVGTVLLLAANIVVFIATGNGWTIHDEVVRNFALPSQFSLLRAFTSIFLHANFWHLAGNMWFLYLFGFAVEGRLKTPKYLALYFAAGLGGAFLDNLASTPIGVHYSLGASGAIMGVVGAALYMFPFSKIDILYGFSYFWWGTFTANFYWVAIAYLGMDVLEALLFRGADGVGHLAHIGGAAIGVVFCLILRARRDTGDVSSAKESFFESGDYSTLTFQEFRTMYAAEPNNTTLVANWMFKCASLRHWDDECTNAFHRLLPRIMAEQPPRFTAVLLLDLAQYPGTITPAYLLEASARVEALGEPSLALRLMEAALQDPAIPEAEVESSLFHTALLHEKLRDYARAQACYMEVVRRFPMSPIADQAKMRLGSLKV